MQLYAQQARLTRGWARDVVFDIDDRGLIVGIEEDAPAPPAGATRTAGPILPGMPNLHCHAFQRAFAGLTERRAHDEDDFWTWRSVMYALVQRLSPEHMQAIAEQLYVEMLKAGFTAVGEFHYVHNDPAGHRYATLTETSDRVIAAAALAGIAITHLPVLYAHGGFGAKPPDAGQRRFVHDLESFTHLLEALYASHGGDPNVRIGIAPHSLRAVTPVELKGAIEALEAMHETAPIHIHIAEQTAEVEACRHWCGAAPVEWLYANCDIDERWCLVHATHADDEELESIAASGAVVGLCPTTEANLGDGVFPARRFMDAGGRFGVGTDSNVSVSPVEELRLLEYTQRCVLKKRTLLARPGESVGARLYLDACRFGARALDLRAGALDVGTRADLVVLDAATPVLAGCEGDQLLDAMVFAGNRNPVRDVMVAGRWRVREGRHDREEPILARFMAVQNEIRRG